MLVQALFMWTAKNLIRLKWCLGWSESSRAQCCVTHVWPRGYKTWDSQTQNKAQWLAACGHVSASNQSLRFILTLYFEFDIVLQFYNLEAWTHVIFYGFTRNIDSTRSFFISLIFFLFFFSVSIWRCIGRTWGHPQYRLCLETLLHLFQPLEEPLLQDCNTLLRYLYSCGMGLWIRLYFLLSHMVHHTNIQVDRHELQYLQEIMGTMCQLLLWTLLYDIRSLLPPI